MLAYEEGELDFNSFAKILDEIILSEINAQDAHFAYVASLFQLKYYTSTY
jgi:hypothetical protein